MDFQLYLDKFADNREMFVFSQPISVCLHVTPTEAVAKNEKFKVQGKGSDVGEAVSNFSGGMFQFCKNNRDSLNKDIVVLKRY